jgi:hypothetical protein
MVEHTIREDESNLGDLILHLMDHHSKYIIDSNKKYRVSFKNLKNTASGYRRNFIEITKNTPKQKPLVRIWWYQDEEDGENAMIFSLLNICKPGTKEFDEIESQFENWGEEEYRIMNCNYGMLPDRFFLQVNRSRRK